MGVIAYALCRVGSMKDIVHSMFPKVLLAIILIALMSGPFLPNEVRLLPVSASEPVSGRPAQVCNIDSGKCFTRIQDAIDDPTTLEGHTLKIGPGIHMEHVKVNKSLSIVGEGPSITIVQAFAHDRSLFSIAREDDR